MNKGGPFRGLLPKSRHVVRVAWSRVVAVGPETTAVLNKAWSANWG